MPAGKVLQQLPLGPGVRILTSDTNGAIALEKPEGVRAHPNDGRPDRKALLHAPYNEAQRCYHGLSAVTPGEALYLVNRLDAPTSGVLLAALNEGTAAALRVAFEAFDVTKIYYALVRTASMPPKGTWSDKMLRQHGGGKLRADVGKGLEAQTRYKFLQRDARGLGVSLIELQPVTGRTHQLRVHCAKHGCPILGDKTYGDFKWNRRLQQQTDERRLFLHAGVMEIHYKIKNRKHTLRAESPLPAVFQSVLDSRH